MLVTWRAANCLTRLAAIQLIEKNLGATISLRMYEYWEQGQHEPHGLTKAAIERMIGDDKC